MKKGTVLLDAKMGITEIQVISLGHLFALFDIHAQNPLDYKRVQLLVIY